MENEVKIDNVNREKIWKPVVEEWLDSFKSDETPELKRIVDYNINGWGVNLNNEDKIMLNIFFEVTPVDVNNTEWETPQRNIVYLEMSKIDGEFEVDYLSNFPKGYDKFMEEFEKWQETQAKTETIILQGESKEFVSNEKIQQISNGIVGVCVILISIVIISIFLKNKKQKAN